MFPCLRKTVCFFNNLAACIFLFENFCLIVHMLKIWDHESDCIFSKCTNLSRPLMNDAWLFTLHFLVCVGGKAVDFLNVFWITSFWMFLYTYKFLCAYDAIPPHPFFFPSKVLSKILLPVCWPDCASVDCCCIAIII